jgi:L,D-peptidoglycan transpeptidase YkuD (ErfK/YbiS/YcfS/YnhG family)
MSQFLPKSTLLLPFLVSGILPGPPPQAAPEVALQATNPTAQAEQIVLVRTTAWDSPTGTLVCFERERLGDPWRQVGDPCDINVGRTGLAWGVGLHGGTLGGGPEKCEGDGKSPAGAFRLSAVYGYAPRDSVRFLRLPYIEATSTCQCVDDPRSAYYNLVLDSLDVAQADWTSRERMRPQTGEWNRWGVIVDHNMSPREPGRGSCIFLHVTEGRGVPTSGCTSMEEERILALIRWLDAGKHPLLVQLPQAEYVRWKPDWRLP